MSVSPLTSYLWVPTASFRFNEPRPGEVRGNKWGQSFVEITDESLADDDYDLTGLDVLTVEVLVQLQQLLDNENIECINLFDENKNAIFSVRHEYEVIDTSFSKALGRKIRAFAPIDDEEDAAKKHVNLLPEDFFSNELVDTGFQLIEELLRLSDCDQSGDVFVEIVLKNKRGVKGAYNLPKA